MARSSMGRISAVPTCKAKFVTLMRLDPLEDTWWQHCEKPAQTATTWFAYIAQMTQKHSKKVARGGADLLESFCNGVLCFFVKTATRNSFK